MPQTWLVGTILLICTPTFADTTEAGKTFRDCPECPEMVVIPAGSFVMGVKSDQTQEDNFQKIVANYRAAKPKPQLPEEARKFRVQAEFEVQKKQFDKAAELYGKALEVAPWWPEGHYNRALILGETEKYRDAISEMKRYLLLVPDAPDARVMQDKIYQWETEAEPAAEIDQEEKPAHLVTISQSFAIGKTEVTEGQWKAIMGNNPSVFGGGLFKSGCGDTCPVENVSWDEVQEFINRLNIKTGKHFRLPSEAEWEYACRAGQNNEYCGSDKVVDVAWYDANSEKKPHYVAQRQANAWGLYDMSGNVWEWVEDSLHTNYNGAPTDGSAWEGGDTTKRVLRGGSWYEQPHNTRTVTRDGNNAEAHFNDNGFRLARTLP